MFISSSQQKNRQPFLRDRDIRIRLHSQLGGISKTLGCAPLLTGGVEDHVHMLARFGRTITQAELVKELKRVSNLWLKEQCGLWDFEWQGGYADFSVSESNLLKGQTIHLSSGRASQPRKFSRRTTRTVAAAPPGMGRTLHLGLTQPRCG